PRGDFYAGVATPVSMAFSIVGDNAGWRETYTAHSRVQYQPFGPDDETTELRVELKRVLHNPDPPTPVTARVVGSIRVKICDSARKLQRVPAPTIASTPVEVRVGKISFK